MLSLTMTNLSAGVVNKTLKILNFNPNIQIAIERNSAFQISKKVFWNTIRFSTNGNVETQNMEKESLTLF